MYRIQSEIPGIPVETYREARLLLENFEWPARSFIEVLCPVHGWSRVVADGSCLPCYAQLAEECGDDETIWGYDPD
jgi:hypothetical protein